MDSWELAKVDLSSISDAEARELLTTWSGLIYKLATRYYPHDASCNVADLDDFLAIGRHALLEAKVTYDETKGAKWITWCHTIVSRRLWEAARRLRGQSRADARTAASVVELDKRRKLRESAEIRGIEPPEFDSEDPDVTDKALEQLLELQARRVLSLNETVRNDGGSVVKGNGLTREEVVADPAGDDESPEAVVAFREEMGWLWAAWLERLDRFEREVILLILKGNSGHAVATRKNYSRQRISQVKESALKKLREAVLEHGED